MTPGKLQARIHWPKRIRNPLNGHVSIACYSDYVKAHRRCTEAAISRNKKRGGADEFPLLVRVHGMACLGEAFRAAAAYFNKRQALSIHHDQVDFAAAGTEIACDRPETLPEQELECRLFGALS